MIANGVLKAFLLLRAANVSPAAERLGDVLTQSAAEQAVAYLVYVVVLLRAGHYIQARHLAE